MDLSGNAEAALHPKNFKWFATVTSQAAVVILAQISLEFIRSIKKWNVKSKEGRNHHGWKVIPYEIKGVNWVMTQRKPAVSK